MELKDYYKILELDAPATLAQIKKAYRRLAQQYHPDKSTGHEYAPAYFAEIKEAYEVLTNPVKKEQYLQQRWYLQSLGKRAFTSQPVTPPVILKQLIELNKYVSALDSFRMDREALYRQLTTILSDDSIEALKRFNEADINQEISKTAMRTAENLESHHIDSVAARLYALNEQNPEMAAAIELFKQDHRKKKKREKYRPVIVILATIIICIVIYFASR